MTRQAPFALRHGGAVRMRPVIGPFAAAADATPAALADLLPLVGEDGAVLLEREVPPLPPELAVAGVRATAQMVAAGLVLPIDGPEPGVLGDADAAEMLALATLTRPGPFAAETHRLGRFVGVREGGRLVAMAGERMRVPGFTEASGVCTDPDARGRGLARGLLATVLRGIVARGETPFLHVYADNAGAIALYETLGLRRRALLQMVLVRRR